MIIALDYDGTYTKDPSFWDNFIDSADGKHEIICVTMRHDNEEERINMKIDVIYTARRAKAHYLNDSGIEIDIWIDDNPGWIYNNA